MKGINSLTWFSPSFCLNCCELQQILKKKKKKKSVKRSFECNMNSLQVFKSKFVQSLPDFRGKTPSLFLSRAEILSQKQNTGGKFVSCHKPLVFQGTEEGEGKVGEEGGRGQGEAIWSGVN